MNSPKLLDRLLDISPRKILRWITKPNPQEKSSLGKVDPLNRRVEGGQLLPLPRSFIAERDKITADILCQIFDDPSDAIDKHLKTKDLCLYSERVVEYPFVLNELLKIKRKKNKPFDLLDVGCTLNNDVIASYIEDVTNIIWFMNPAVEPLVYKSNAVYVVSDVRTHKLPKGLKFDCVTCISTLEHIGMDNTRYGVPGREINPYPDHPERNAIEAMRCLLDLVKAGGTLLITVPFGPFEYLYSYGNPLPIYYTFDKPRLMSLIDSLSIANVKYSIYKDEFGVGWVKTDIDDLTIVKQSVGRAAAGAVACMSITKQ